MYSQVSCHYDVPKTFFSKYELSLIIYLGKQKSKLQLLKIDIKAFT